MAPAYIENRILDFKRENAAQKMFESTTVSFDADKKPLPLKQLRKIWLT
jgi:hypothetical protein